MCVGFTEKSSSVTQSYQCHSLLELEGGGGGGGGGTVLQSAVFELLPLPELQKCCPNKDLVLVCTV